NGPILTPRNSRNGPYRVAKTVAPLAHGNEHCDSQCPTAAPQRSRSASLSPSAALSLAARSPPQPKRRCRRIDPAAEAVPLFRLLLVLLHRERIVCNRAIFPIQ